MSERVARPGSDRPAGPVRAGGSLFGRPGWMAQARCRDTETAVFFDAAKETEAIRCCAGCAVRPACLAYALETAEPDGVWGGLPARRRREIIGRATLADRRSGPARWLNDDDLSEILSDADPTRPAIEQLCRWVPLSRAGAYLYLARARDLGLVERRGRALYPTRH